MSLVTLQASEPGRVSTETSEPGCCPGERRFSAVLPRPRKYPEELLERGVRLALESGRPIAHVAADLGIIPRRCVSGCAERRLTRASARICRRARSVRRSSACGKRISSFGARTRSSSRRACFSPRSSTQTDRSERATSTSTASASGSSRSARTLGVSVSAYYERANGRRSARAVEDERLLARIRELHAANYYAYGYRRMWKALRRAGEQVAALPRPAADEGNGIQGAKRRGKPWRTTTARPQARSPPRPRRARLRGSGPEPALGRRPHLPALLGRPRLLRLCRRRLFAAWSSAGNSRPTCAPTSSSTRCGWLSAAAAPAPTSRWCTTAIAAANTPASTSPRAHRPWRPRLCRLGRRRLRQRARRDLPRQLKTELISDRVWRTRSQLELAVVEYLGWFNDARLHESLGDIPPAEYEQLHALEEAITLVGATA